MLHPSFIQGAWEAVPELPSPRPEQVTAQRYLARGCELQKQLSSASASLSAKSIISGSQVQRSHPQDHMYLSDSKEVCIGVL